MGREGSTTDAPQFEATRHWDKDDKSDGTVAEDVITSTATAAG